MSISVPPLTLTVTYGGDIILLSYLAVKILCKLKDEKSIQPIIITNSGITI